MSISLTTLDNGAPGIVVNHGEINRITERYICCMDFYIVPERSRTSPEVTVRQLTTGMETAMIQVLSSTFARATLASCLLGFLAAQSHAAIIVSSPSPKALVPGGTYQAAVVTTYLTPSGPTFLSSVSFFDIFTELSTDFGLNAHEDATVGGWGGMELPLPVPHTEPLPYTGTALANVTGGASTQPPTGTFDTEMLSLSLTGITTGFTPTPVSIRESPTLASSGMTTVTDLGGGSYRIDSFFDIFTELSLDGGATWTPSTASTHFDLVDTTVPLPAATWLFLSGLAALGVVRGKTGRG
jgi:hypothetical protein